MARILSMKFAAKLCIARFLIFYFISLKQGEPCLKAMPVSIDIEYPVQYLEFDLSGRGNLVYLF